MSFENPQEQTESPVENVVESHVSQGVAADFRAISSAVSAKDTLNRIPEAQKLFSDVEDLIDRDAYPASATHARDIAQSISLVAGENGWTDYDSINFDKIREELEAAGVPLRKKRTAADYRGGM